MNVYVAHSDRYRNNDTKNVNKLHRDDFITQLFETKIFYVC